MRHEWRQMKDWPPPRRGMECVRCGASVWAVKNQPTDREVLVCGVSLDCDEQLAREVMWS